MNLKSKNIKSLFTVFLTIILLLPISITSKLIFENINPNFKYIGIIAGLIISILLFHNLIQYITMKLFDLLKTTRFITGYDEGKVIRFHVHKGLRDLKKYSFTSLRIFEDAFYAINEICNRKKSGELLFNKFEKIFGISFLLWSNSGRNKTYRFLENIFKIADEEVEIYNTKMTFLKKLAFATNDGLLNALKNENLKIFNKTELGVFSINISTIEKCDKILTKIHPFIDELNAINNGKSQKTIFDVLIRENKFLY